jgi:hypothetical protein
MSPVGPTRTYGIVRFRAAVRGIVIQAVLIMSTRPARAPSHYSPTSAGNLFHFGEAKDSFTRSKA